MEELSQIKDQRQHIKRSIIDSLILLSTISIICYTNSSKIDDLIDILISVIVDIINTYTYELLKVNVYSKLLSELDEKDLHSILTKIPTEKLLNTLEIKLFHTHDNNLKNQVIQSIINDEKNLYLGNFKDNYYYLDKDINEPIFCYEIIPYKNNHIWYFQMKIFFTHFILDHKIKELERNIKIYRYIDIEKSEYRYIRILNKHLKKVYSINIVKEIPIFYHDKSQLLFNNIIYYIIYESKLIIEKNWSSYCLWKTRVEYISLIEGIEMKSKDETHITHYLFNDLLMKEICSYLYE